MTFLTNYTLVEQMTIQTPSVRTPPVTKNSSERVLLIVPCFNETDRLNLSVFAQYSDYSFLFCDDGSTDQTFEILKKFEATQQSEKSIWAYRCEQNQGKGNAIWMAYQFAKSEGLLSKFEWIGFWDADLATPLTEVQYFLNYQQTFAPEKKLIFGSRILRYGSHIVRDPFRHYLSRVFVTFTDLVLGIKCYDSQCGAKLFHISVVDQVFKEKFLSRWIFDLEIIKRIDKNLILEVPVRQWQDIPGSKVKFFREIFRVLNDLFRIRKNYK